LIIKKSTSLWRYVFSFLFKKKLSIWARSTNYYWCGWKHYTKWWTKINVDIDQLIETIYIHPKSENWYKNLSHWLVKQLGFDFAIEKSDLESDILILKFTFIYMVRNWIHSIIWQINNYNAQHHFIKLSILLVSSSYKRFWLYQVPINQFLKICRF
jgi:hypothetical protein